MSITLTFGLCLLSGLIGAALTLLWIVPRMEAYFVFRPTREISRTPADIGIPYLQEFIETSDGTKLCLWHLRPPKPIASIVYFHGNSGNLGLYTEIFRVLYEHGFHVVAPDYRGYGLSEGSPSEKGIYRDGLATVDYFRRNLAISGLPVVFWGRSLGGCVAARTSISRKPDRLILETTFPSKKKLLEHLPQFRSFRFFSRYRFDTVRYLKTHTFPVLVIHGTADKTIPFTQGEALFQSLTGPKEFYAIEGADHVNTHRRDTEEYVGRIRSFVCGPMGVQATDERKEGLPERRAI